MLAAFVSIPLLIRGLGEHRFGFLSIAWMLIGYFGLLDLGIGRALTHGVARRFALKADADVSDLIGTGLLTLAGLGTLLGAIIVVSSRWIVADMLVVPPELQSEAGSGLVILAFALPFVVVTAGLRGVLEARQQFKAINLVMVPLGSLLFLAPLLVAQFSPALPHVLGALLAVRALTTLALFVLCTRQVADFLSIRLSMDALRQLFSFGGWMTVSNVVSPVMVNMDRIFIGSRISLAAVTDYVTPAEVVTKLLVVPGSIANAAFPEFVRLAAAGPSDEARRYFMRCLMLVAGFIVPAAAVLALIAHPLLAWWISEELATRSAGIMRILALGVVLNGLAYIPFAYIQGAGRADLTAKFHLIELAVYVPALLLLIQLYGVVGVAIAWVLRVALDAALLFGRSAVMLRARPRG